MSSKILNSITAAFLAITVTPCISLGEGRMDPVFFSASKTFFQSFYINYSLTERKEAV